MTEGITVVVVVGAAADVRHATVGLAGVLDRQAAVVLIRVDRHAIDQNTSCARHGQILGGKAALYGVRHSISQERIVQRDLERLTLRHERARHTVLAVRFVTASRRMRHTLQVRSMVRSPKSMNYQEVIVAEGCLHS